MKKVVIVIAVLSMVFVIASSIAVVYLSSNDARNSGYVRLTVNPQIEFVCEGDKVVSYMALNQEAKYLCANEEFTNLNVFDATHKFIDLCARAGYMDFDDMDNAVGIACVSGLSQTLETMVYKTVSDYLKENQIFGAILESYNDNQTVKDAIDLGVTTDKYELVKAILHYNPNANINKIKKYSRVRLLKELTNYHKEIGSPTTNYSEQDLASKNSLLENNREKFAEHQSAITTETQRDFKNIFIANQKQLKQKIRNDFNSSYEIWKKSHVNFVG